MGKVRSISAAAQRNMAKLGATIDDVVAALEKKPSKVRVTVDAHGKLTKIEAGGEVKPPGTAGGGRAGGGAHRAAGSPEVPKAKGPPGSGQESELVAVSAERDAIGAAPAGGAGGAGPRRTVGGPKKEPPKKEPSKTETPPAAGVSGSGQKPPKRPTARGSGDDGDRPGNGGNGEPPTQPGGPVPIQVRLQELYRRLRSAPAAKSAKEAMQQVEDTLNAVEDELSGVRRKIPPPPPNMPDGRLYAPLPDRITKRPDGTLVGETRGHTIEASPDGGITITNRKTGQIEFTK
jgi:hypothetical protein